MARLSPVVLGIALALLTSPVLSQDKCRSGCTGGAANLFKFADGTTYKYNLEGHTDIQISSAEGQISNTKIKATVLLTQLPQCNQVLRLQNVEIIGADGKKYTNIPNIEKPVKLNFHDGHVEDIICAEKGDTQVSLNIKRAVASMIQANLKKDYETDVFGVCPTDLSSKKEGDNTVITKHKNLNRCSHRENIRETFMSTAFDLNSEMKSSPILDADYSSEQKINKNGILQSVTVTENYLYMPFSVGKNGAKAVVQTKLTLAGQSKETPKQSCNEPKTIIFDNPHPIPTEKPNANNLIDALKKAVGTITDVVQENTAGQYINVVQIMRVSSKADLLRAYDEVKKGTGFQNKDIAQQFFFNAITKAGTGEAVEVILTLLKTNEVKCKAAEKIAYLGLNFVRHATPASVAAAAEILDNKDVPKEAYLGVGSLVGTFCQQHKGCQNDAAVKALTKKYLTKLPDGKCANKQQENDMVYILKSIKNMQFLTDALAVKISGIANNKNHPNRLRVAALEACLADPCNNKCRDTSINIMKDIQQDSELRIKGYLTAASCANAKVAQAVKKVLEDEPKSVQVNGFIVSHIRNLKASTNPDKALAKQHLGNIYLSSTKYPIDFRRFSHNFEVSHALKSLGVASSVEADLIYSQTGFLPRSTSLNLTADVFGHRYNFLEVAARQENLEKVMEHYLGPRGLLRTKEGQSQIDKHIAHLKEKLQQRTSELGKAHRRRRDVSKAEIDAIGKEVQIKTNELNKDLDLDLSIKMLGSEIYFESFTDAAKEFSVDSIVDKLFDYADKGIAKAKNFDGTYHHSSLFLDVELAYPTSMGFPLKITIDAASSSQLQTKGSIDIMAILSESAHTTAELKMIPSVSVEVLGKLTLDAHLIESGLKIGTTLHSSTGGAMKMELYNDKKKGYDIRYTLPLEKQELFSANNEIVLTTRELGQTEHDKALKFAQPKDFEVCADQLSEFIGLSFCAKINTPGDNPHATLPFPFDGHSKLGVTITKEDLKEYHLKHIVEEDVSADGAFEVIGKNDVKLSLKSALQLVPEKFFKLDFKAKDLKTAGIEGKFTDTDTEKSILLKYYMDEQQGFAKAGILFAKSGSGMILRPILDYKYPNMNDKPVRVEGQLILAQTGDSSIYTFDKFKIISPQHTIAVTGSVGQKATSYFSDISVNDGKHTGSLKGSVAVAPSLKIDGEMKNTFNPDANFKLNYNLIHDDKTPYDSKLELTHGKDLNSKENKFTMHNSLTGDFADDDKDDVDYYQTKNELSYPAADVKLKLSFGETLKSANYDVAVEYKKIKFGSKLDLKYDEKVEDDYDLLFTLYGAQNNLKLTAKRVIKGDKSDITNTLEVNKKTYDLKGTITHIDSDTVTNYSGDLVAHVPQNQQYKLSYGIVIKGENVDLLLKAQSGGTVVMDNFLKITGDGNANGQVKMAFKGLLNANGQLKSVKGSGTGNLILDFAKIGKKVKADSTFTFADPTYNLDLTLFTDFEKDNNKKYVLSTHNKVGETTIDTQNSFEYNGQKLKANMKGDFQGDLWDGKQKVDAEVIFPNDMYLAGKLDRDIHTSEEDVINGNAVLTIEQRKNKNTPGVKVNIQATIKDTDIAEDVYDLVYHITVDNSAGKNLVGDFVIKNKPVGEDKWILDLKSKLSGSVISQPFEGNLYSESTDETGNYKFNLAYGPKNTLDVSGKYDFDGDTKPLSGEIDLVLKTSNPNLAIFKFHNSGSLGIGLKEGNVFEVKDSTSIFFDSSPSENTFDVKYDGYLSVGEKEVETQNSLKFQKEDPITVSGKYFFDEDDEKNMLKAHGTSTISYGKGKTLKLDFNYDQPKLEKFDLDIKLLTPIETAKNTHFTWKGVKSDDGKKIDWDLNLNVDNKVYTAKSHFEETPAFSLVIKSPDGKTYEVAMARTKDTPTQKAIDLKIIWSNNFALTSSVDAIVESVDSFNINLKVNCPNLKLDNFVLDAVNKGGKGAKKIEFSAKNANKNMLSGSTNYKTRDEGGKFTVEGSGTIKYYEEAKSANFKFSKQSLTIDKHGEEGIDLSFDASIGNKAVDAEFKATNKHFRFLNSLCEEKKQCSHVEVDAKTSTSSDSIEHVLEVNVDLRKIGLPHEFGLKSVSSLKGYIVDHTLDVHFESQDKSKYQYSLYYHPTKAGSILTTPKRIVAIEAEITPVQKDKTNSLQGHLYIYPDKKNKPNEKTALNGWMEFKKTSDKSTQSSYGIKFTTPGLPKPLSIEQTTTQDDKKFEITNTVDIFAKPNQKIVSHGVLTHSKNGLDGLITIKSPGLNLDIKAADKATYDLEGKRFSYNYELNYLFDKLKFQSVTKLEVTEHEIKAFLKMFDKDILNYQLKEASSGDTLTLDNTVQLLGFKPIVGHLEVKGHKSAKLVAYRKDTPNSKLIISSTYTPGQLISHNAEYIHNGKKVSYGHAKVQLDKDNFLKSDYDVNTNEIKAKAENFKNEILDATTVQKQFVDNIIKENSAYPKQVIEVLSGAVPNFKPAKEYYVGQLDSIKHELLSDKTLAKIEEFMKVIKAYVETWVEIFGKVMEFVEKISHTFLETLKKIAKLIEESNIKDKFNEIENLGKQVFIAVYDTTTTVITNLIEMTKPIQKLREFFGAYSKEFNEFAQKFFESLKEITTAIKQEVHNAIENLKQLPIMQQIKQTINELQQEGGYKNVIEGILNELKNFAEGYTTSPKISKFINDLYNYLTKKLEDKPVDDKAVIKQLVKDFIEIAQQFSIADELTDPTKKQNFINLSFLQKLPVILGADSSIINHLFEDDEIELDQILYNVAFNPKLWVPPLELQAIVVQGQHIFTFDGKHLTFPGTCNYLLARDAMNGNFTIAGSYKDGFLTAITVSDKHNSVTIKNNGQALLNNQASEYPVVKDTIVATKEYSHVKIETKYGAKVICDFELKGCSFYISGFYHGQLRGLLGNGNSEPFDDFTTANGKIVANEGDFGNSYKMGGQCKDVKTVDHKKHAHDKTCTEYFADEDSDLSECFSFVPVSTFRTACDHGMAANIKDTVQNIVYAYAAACNNRGIPVDVPDQFVKCTNGEKPRSVDESFNVKMPSKAADVVFVIDEVKTNEPLFKDLVQNVIAEMNKEFNAKKISDIEYHFIGYGGEHEHGPYHYTVGGKFISKGKLPAIKFSSPKDNGEKSERQQLVENLKTLLGIHPQGKAYTEAIKYPFRAHAYKSVVAITGKPCQNEYIDEDVLELVTELRTLFIDDEDISLNLVTPFTKEEFSCKDTKTTNSIIGFNKDNVITFNDAKKKPLGSSDLHKDLKYDDYCVDYTINNGGNVFVSNNFLSAKGPQRKLYASTVAHNIINKFVEKPERISCQCTRQNAFTAKNVCESHDD